MKTKEEEEEEGGEGRGGGVGEFSGTLTNYLISLSLFPHW